jgi:two-component system NtrC family sensor kinase
MNLQTKFALGILIVFAILAASIALVSVAWINQNSINEAEQRVKLYIQSSWEIYDNKLARMQAALEILALDPQARDLLRQPQNESLARAVQINLQANRLKQNMDVLNLLDAEGRVIVRSRPPYTRGDSLAYDPLVRQVMFGKEPRAGTILLSKDRLEESGEGLLQACVQACGDSQGMMLSVVVPILDDGKLIGLLQIGNLLNGSTDKVDRVRDTVFKNEMYKGKPLGTATIFMGDLRVSTNVLDNFGNRAVGTRAATDVAAQVLKRGVPWTGRAWVVDTWYISQYDPIRDPDGNVIGMLYVGELEQKYLDLRAQATLMFLGITFAGMVLALIVFFFILRNIIEPLQNLSRATKQLSAGDLSHRVAITTRDEVGNLAQSFNEMAEQLERQRAELTATNRNYMETLGFVTHELKNPLSSAMLNVHTVKDGYIGTLNEKQKGALEAVARNLDYFNHMIRNYLDLSRLEKGELQIKLTRVNVSSDVLAPVIEGLDRARCERQMIFENNVPAQMLVNADRDLLRIVYDNLIANAIKYGREGGRIVIAGESEQAIERLSVFNEGSGIAQDKLGLLFQKFSRLPNPEYAGKKGTGLGLYICHEIIEKHGGKIWAESEVGKWTRFVFTLPRG